MYSSASCWQRAHKEAKREEEEKAREKVMGLVTRALTARRHPEEETI